MHFGDLEFNWAKVIFCYMHRAYCGIVAYRYSEYQYQYNTCSTFRTVVRQFDVSAFRTHPSKSRDPTSADVIQQQIRRHRHGLEMHGIRFRCQRFRDRNDGIIRRDTLYYDVIGYDTI